MIKVGKYYLVIGNLCVGFGQPPQEYINLIDRSRRNRGV